MNVDEAKMASFGVRILVKIEDFLTKITVCYQIIRKATNDIINTYITIEYNQRQY